MSGKSISSSARRIQKELAEISLEPPTNCSAGPKGDNLYEWVSTIVGPSGACLNLLTARASDEVEAKAIAWGLGVGAHVFAKVVCVCVCDTVTCTYAVSCRRSLFVSQIRLTRMASSFWIFSFRRITHLSRRK
jgi:hypothetical protein